MAASPILVQTYTVQLPPHREVLDCRLVSLGDITGCRKTGFDLLANKAEVDLSCAFNSWLMLCDSHDEDSCLNVAEKVYLFGTIESAAFCQFDDAAPNGLDRNEFFESFYDAWWDWCKEARVPTRFMTHITLVEALWRDAWAAWEYLQSQGKMDLSRRMPSNVIQRQWLSI